MADNIATSANTVAFDDVGGVKFQRVKLGLGADGTAADAVGGTGVDGTGVQRVSLATDIALPAGENHVGEVAQPRDVISVTPTVSTTPAYTSGDAVGGKETITGAARVSGGKVELDSLVVIDKGNQKAALTVLIFDSDPAAATITDNTAFAFSTDISKLVGKINVATADYETVDGKAVACLRGLGLTMKASGSANLYAAVVTTGTPTYVSAGDLTLRYGFLQN